MNLRRDEAAVHRERRRDKMKEKLQKYMEEKGLDGFFIAKKENVRYISKYTGWDSYLLITRGTCYFITDPRYTEQAALECPDYEIYVWRKPGCSVADALAAISQRENLKTLAFEGDVMNFRQYFECREKIRAELVPAEGVIEKIRSVKTPEEIASLRISCDIACRAFERLVKEIRVGVTEKELSARLVYYMTQEGADAQPNGILLISGARTSLLHGVASSKAIEYGDFVLMDFGCQYKGYISDMTRTVVVGKADRKQREVYELEKRMLEDALGVMKAGVLARDVYKASTRAIEGTEYMQYHYSNVGHGVGLFVHELPFASPSSEDVLEENNVRTIEPGLYIPGWGGVRIEDQVCITKDGYENFVRIPHDLMEL